MRYVKAPDQLMLIPPPYRYAIDACSMFTQNYDRVFPRKMYPAQWRKIDAMVRDHEIVTCLQIRKEIANTGDEAAKWVESSGLYVIEESFEVQQKVVTIVNEHPELIDFSHNKSSGDAFLIATAMVYGLEIITEEKQTSSKKIPMVARSYGIQSYSMREFCQAQGWGP